MKQLPTSVLLLIITFLFSPAVLLLCVDATINELTTGDYCPVDGQVGDGNRAAHESASKDTETGGGGDDDDGCFRAAVVEHRPVDLDEAGQSAVANLEQYRRVAKLAATHGANIIVFPEDGIFIGTKSYIAPALTEIPDPSQLNSTNNNPCYQPGQFDESLVILRNLSCIARESGLFVVANFGTKQSCKAGSKVGQDRICPQQGYLMLNTDVVFDSRGNFIRRYRKYNMFLEVFDKAPKLEQVYFDSPFGRFGIFTCFDMMFKRPAIELVEQLNIDTALFPTWWFDELPLLSAVQVQDGWSSSNRVNLLASNMHKPKLGSTGSGIFSGRNSAYVGADADRSKLVIATLPKHPNAAASTSSKKCDRSFDPLILDIDSEDTPEQEYLYKQYSLLPNDAIYPLTAATQERRTICQGQVCCTIDYKIATSSVQSSEEAAKVIDDHRLVLIVRDTLRPGHFRWYEQVCVLATLATPLDIKELPKTVYSKVGLVKFDKLYLKGTFNSQYVYPITSHNVSQLVDRKEREFNCDRLGRGQEEKLFSCKLNYTGTPLEPIGTFGMYARLYERDRMPKGW